MKTIKDFNNNLLNISKMRLKFKKKMKKKLNIRKLRNIKFIII